MAANADTREVIRRAILIFPVSLKSDGAWTCRRSSVALALTSLTPYSAQAMTAPTTDLFYRIPDQPSLDGNTVDMDRERTQLCR